MKTRPAPRVALLFALAASASAAVPRSDLAPVSSRAQAVRIAQMLVARTEPPAVADLKNPFNPAAFEAQEQSSVVANRSIAVTPPSDAALLEKLALLLPATGKTDFRGARLLTLSGARRVAVGDTMQVRHLGTDYDLDVVAIDEHAFTVAWRGQRFTRPITVSPPRD